MESLENTPENISKQSKSSSRKSIPLSSPSGEISGLESLSNNSDSAKSSELVPIKKSKLNNTFKKSILRSERIPRPNTACNQFTKAECNPPRCEYIEGATRSYCRLSRKYRRVGKSGHITRRIKTSESEIVARKKISEFLKNTTKITKIVCAKSGDCISFGKKTAAINKLFKGFTGFEYAISPIKKIGAVSANGFVKEIEYERDGYKAHAILKSAQNPGSDNLVYEYLVGNKYINRFIKRFPCFVETYGHYYYRRDNDWNNMQILTPIDKKQLKGLELQSSIDYAKACSRSKYASILIQHIHSAKSLNASMPDDHYNDFTKFELIYVLFIVYHALASLSKTFTHYDLHDDNVLLFEPQPGKYIHYHYYLKDGRTVDFKCSVIPKIIDYGRSFFDNGNVSSKTIYDKMCKAIECVDCGQENGFTWLDATPYFGISSQQKNESHDLRLLIKLKFKLNDLVSNGLSLPKENSFTEVKKMLKKLIYGEGINDPNDREYGTVENLKPYPDGIRISNVTNTYEYLKKSILKPNVMAENERKFANPADKIGDFHIYEDGRDMEYVPL
jgi:hypothetical protein